VEDDFTASYGNVVLNINYALVEYFSVIYIDSTIEY